MLAAPLKLHVLGIEHNMQRLKITKVNSSGAASCAGLQINDYLDAYNGIPLNSSGVLSNVMKTYFGQTHIMSFIRGYEVFEVELIAGSLGVLVEPSNIDENLVRRNNRMKISTTPFIPGFRVVQSIDVVTAECVYGMNIFKDLLAGLTDVFGGRSNTTQKILRDARRNCLSELRAEAASVGANAVVGVHLDYSELSGQGKSMLFLVASGTAVLVEPDA